LPYTVTHDLSNSVGIVPNVHFNNDPVYVLNQSTQPCCVGDAPGSCHGVKSGTTSGEVKPVQGASHFFVSKKAVIRQGDPCTLNGGNCPGIYITTQEPHAKGSVNTIANSPSTSPPIQPETDSEQQFLAGMEDAMKAAGEHVNTIKLLGMAGVSRVNGLALHHSATFVPGTEGD
jgi:uncharacterized Zn-binding protein involved in type VI secretion